MTAEEEELRRACAIVGELILLASALDGQLNRILISLLVLTESPMLESVVATIDVRQKIRILKARARKAPEGAWKKAMERYAMAAEEVNDVRNVAAHSQLKLERGRAVLWSPAAAKLLKSINITTKTAEKVRFERLEAAIKKAERTLGSGAELLERLERMATEHARRYPPKG